MAQREGEHYSEYAARLAVEALAKSGKSIYVVGYGSLSDPKEFANALPERVGDPPRPVKIDGWSRIWTVSDALNQPAKPRVFVNKFKERFRGYWASFGVAPRHGESMAATVAKVSPEELVTLAGREVSYSTRIISHEAVTDPETGQPIVDDNCVAIAFVPLRRYQAIYRREIELQKTLSNKRRIAVRKGYAQKSLNVAKAGGTSRNWDPLSELEALLNPQEPGSSAPPQVDCDMVLLNPDNPEANLRTLKGIRGSTYEEEWRDLALATKDGQHAARPKSNSLTDYLLPIAEQLRHSGVSRENLQPILDVVQELGALNREDPSYANASQVKTFMKRISGERPDLDLDLAS
jgi:hypothetical protein